MWEAQNKVVSIEAFRTMRRSAGGSEADGLVPVGPRVTMTARSIEHRERMLNFLQGEAKEAENARRPGSRIQLVQGRLLL